MQGNCIIFDTDEQYGKRLMCAISRHKNLPFGVQLFTRADEMEIYLEHHTADMMVVKRAVNTAQKSHVKNKQKKCWC